MLEFDPHCPFPLLPGDALSYSEAQAHSQKIDAWLDLRVDETEARISSRHSTSKRFPQNQLWVGLPPRSLLTPYTEFREILGRLNPKPGDKVVDLGAGYGRMGFVISKHYPEVDFIGYEVVSERVEESLRCFSQIAAQFRTGCFQMHHQDLEIAQFIPILAQFYFIYDFGSRTAIAKALTDLKALAKESRITVVGRGRACRDAIERETPWLSQVEKPSHYPHYSIYTSA